MKSGLLWFDASDSTLDKKLNDAAARYLKKFGEWPNICYVNTKDLAAFATGRDPLTYKMPCRVIPSKTIVPNHAWIGIIAESSEKEPNETVS